MSEDIDENQMLIDKLLHESLHWQKEAKFAWETATDRLRSETKWIGRYNFVFNILLIWTFIIIVSSVCFYIGVKSEKVEFKVRDVCLSCWGK